MTITKVPITGLPRVENHNQSKLLRAKRITQVRLKYVDRYQYNWQIITCLVLNFCDCDC